MRQATFTGQASITGSIAQCH